jgi:hypothetical protein
MEENKIERKYTKKKIEEEGVHFMDSEKIKCTSEKYFSLNPKI